jgi:ADP-dependent NAD(P)H-hydrate dehydratase
MSDPTPVTPNLLREWSLPDTGGSKYGRGQVLVIGGAAKTPGAAMLSATAALRVGGGRLTLAVARSVALHVAVALPESGVQPLDEDEDGHVAVGAIQSLTDDLGSADAVLVGPGLDEPEGSRDLVAGLAAAVGDETVVVLDAFALGVASDLVDELAPLRGRLVMTPNSGEAERLLGHDTSDDHTDAAEIAERFGALRPRAEQVRGDCDRLRHGRRPSVLRAR